jgi:hypothetical protein
MSDARIGLEGRRGSCGGKDVRSVGTQDPPGELGGRRLQ